MCGILGRWPLLTMCSVNVRQQKLKKEEEQEEKSPWKVRSLHGMYCQQTKDMTHTEKSY